MMDELLNRIPGNWNRNFLFKIFFETYSTYLVLNFDSLFCDYGKKIFWWIKEIYIIRNIWEIPPDLKIVIFNLLNSLEGMLDITWNNKQSLTNRSPSAMKARWRDILRHFQHFVIRSQSTSSVKPSATAFSVVVLWSLYDSFVTWNFRRRRS